MILFKCDACGATGDGTPLPRNVWREPFGWFRADSDDKWFPFFMDNSERHACSDACYLKVKDKAQIWVRVYEGRDLAKEMEEKRAAESAPERAS